MKLHNKNGDLSVYGFACGYIQQKDNGKIQVELFKDGCWHIKAYDYSNHVRLMWEVTDSLRTARRIYAQAINTLKTNGQLNIGKNHG